MFTIYPLLKGKESHWSPTAGMIPSVFTKHRVRLENSRWHYLWDQSWVHRWKQKCDLDKIAVWAEEWEKPHQLTHIPYTLLFDFHTATEPFTNRFAKRSYLKVPGWKDKVSRSLSRIFPELKRAKINIIPSASGKEWIGYVEWPDLKPIEIDQFGDGARHAFKVLAGLVALCETVDEEHPGLFLWEDPELFMHPQSLNALLGEMLLLVREKPVQVFLSSQSMEVIALLTSHIQRSKVKVQRDYRVFRLELEDGHLYVAKYHYRNILAWLEEGMDARFWGATKLPFSYRYSPRGTSAMEGA